MMGRLKSLPGWQTAILLFILALPFNLWLFPARTRYLQAQSGASNPILDTWTGYRPEQAFNLIGSLNETGRRLYALSEFTVDLLYPLIYTGILAALLGWLAPLAFPGSGLARSLARLPRVVLVSDYLENVGIACLLLVYPAQPAALAWITCAVTLVKFGLAGICLLAFPIFAGKILVSRWQASH